MDIVHMIGIGYLSGCKEIREGGGDWRFIRVWTVDYRKYKPCPLERPTDNNNTTDTLTDNRPHTIHTAHRTPLLYFDNYMHNPKIFILNIYTLLLSYFSHQYIKCC